ncbi:host specificity protein J [Pseudomonas sp. xss_2]|uniref:host specificity protein J n=1 Tax=Pseudomonas sp. xss_2 TaxID=3367215 RepID=UPI00370A2E92
MGAAAHLVIAGEKGGEKKPKTPVEAPDSLRSTNIAKILLAVGEGEFDGTPTARDIYLDNTPIMDASGNLNFPGVKWEWRPGSVEQEYIKGIPSIENETTVNVELRSDNPFTRALSNTQLSRLRLRFAWPRLARQDKSSGDTNGYRIEYAIDIATDGGAFVESLRGAVDGKTTSGYQRSEPVILPPATSGWSFRVRRLTPNANDGLIADTMTIAGYTEIIDQKIRYPNTALLYIEFDAEQFQNIPAVTVNCNGQRWPVPSNYDPVTRAYTGVWDGTFKQAWTNNPVWATYGLCVNDRFGLGNRIQPWMVDKWEMYRIGQYCDQLVSNGVGGMEPRYLCDLNLQGKAEAWTLLRDLSAIYRGMVYWAQGSLYMQADMPRAQDIDYTFTRSNVIDGDFVYGGAGRDTHYSRALISYDNPANNYDTDVIPVTDNALQRRYRDRPIEISAIGCTRASEAQRRGKWALLSNNQDRTVTFKTGMEGANVLPGFVIPVADELVAGRPNGGRISAVAGRTVTLDRDTPVKAGDRLIVNLPNGTAQARTVQSVAGRTVTVTTAYTLQPEPQLQWAIDYSDLAVQLFRVLKRKRTTEGEYEFTALEFNPSKFAAIDNGAKLEERPISVIPITTVPPPSSVTLTSAHAISQGIAVSTMTIAWPAVEGAVAYDVEWRKDNGNWVRLQRLGATSVDVTGIYAGAYLARVRAVSSFDIASVWRDSMLTELKGKEGMPPAVTFLTATPLIFGISLKWGIPPGAEDTQRTEIWYSPANDLEVATKLTDWAYPQTEYVMQGLAAGVSFFFWARLVDRTGNIGPWYPIGSGVLGQSGSDAGPILELIGGQITESELGQDLLEKIEKIPGLQEQIDALDGLKAYVPEQAYESGEMVVVNSRIYQAVHDVPADPEGGNAPPNVSYWIDVGQSLETANGQAQQVATNTADISELDGVVTAQATAFEALRAAYRDDNGEGDLADALKGWDSTAAIATESRVRATEGEAIAERLTTFDARVASNEANITQLERVVATNESATALKLDQLNVSVGQTNAAVQTTSQALAALDGKASTMWSVKMQVNAQDQYVAAGIGLGIENGPAGLQSQFLVSADRFAVVNGINSTLSSPFAVQGGQVFINQAFIADGTITNAKIGSFISSTNYVAGQQGWILNKSGTFEINGTVAGQGRLLINNQRLRIYHANGNLAIDLGVNV